MRVFIVTGAPGAGKSTALAALLRLRSPYVALDIDWLMTPASDLAGRSVQCDRATWRPYRAERLGPLRLLLRVSARAAVRSWASVIPGGGPRWVRVRSGTVSGSSLAAFTFARDLRALPARR